MLFIIIFAGDIDWFLDVMALQQFCVVRYSLWLFIESKREAFWAYLIVKINAIIPWRFVLRRVCERWKNQTSTLWKSNPHVDWNECTYWMRKSAAYLSTDMDKVLSCVCTFFSAFVLRLRIHCAVPCKNDYPTHFSLAWNARYTQAQLNMNMNMNMGILFIDLVLVCMTVYCLTSIPVVRVYHSCWLHWLSIGTISPAQARF